MKWGNALQELSNAFADFDWLLVGKFFLNPQLGYELVSAMATGLMGWVFAMHATRDRLKSRLIDELILSQREVAKRAYPDDYDGVWKQDAPREVWMMQPFIDRLRFLSANIAEERAINSRAKTAVEIYIERVTEFVAHWARAERRQDAYEYLFMQTHTAFREAVSQLGLQENGKTRGTLPKRFAMRVVTGRDRKRKPRPIQPPLEAGGRRSGTSVSPP